MSVWKRIGNLFSKAPAPVAEKSVLQLSPGDICEVSLVTYEVTGRVSNRSRNTVLLTLRDGADIAYLHIEQREQLQFALYRSIDGRMDSLTEVPATMVLDDETYYLEEEYEGYVAVSGQTPFMNAGEQHVWQFQADNSRLLRIEWQNGRFVLYEGEKTIPGDVRVIRAS
ncbi:DUF4178 domain-containing protein [Paenibacillus spiritus]|uniref:DUF4178 domain-containing protein n=1 Tax=Paenibacillus spiritus TaxID=2496557 RepID=A0A5J5GE88_9BACL|nr:DUF4178 domain-containing protein [Paenibacillus spiritus]KAA9006556.1 DUF4178 domain-containing protein [Paenibacillus spiritus]